MDPKPYTERILETENLTDELTDPDASWLLDWGVHQLDGILPATANEDSANEKVTALMSLMRKINRMVGSRGNKSQEAITTDLAALSTLFAGVYGAARPVTAGEVTATASRLPQASPRQALEILAAWGLKPGGKA